jgi:beta-lactamase regulating signal transducer with metallopeptidase domain
MSTSDLLHLPAAQALGWALVHFIWQGALVVAVTAPILLLLRRSAADVRYVVATIALSIMATMPIVTAVQVWQGESFRLNKPSATVEPSAYVAPSSAGPVVSASLPVTTALATTMPVILEPWLSVLVAVWFCGVLALTLRLASGWVWVQRMKTRGTMPVSDALGAIAARLARRLHIARRVRLFESAHVDVPTVIGWMKPVVLLPASALSGLTLTQLEAILAHELAHIRRHDYLVNLLQTLVETLLFYHPAVWWLSHQIRAERENCCDDLAVALCGDRLSYARALADLEDLRASGGQLVMAASGGSLLQRVRRLLGAPTHAGHAPGWLAGSAAILLTLGFMAGASGRGALEAQDTALPKPTTPVVVELSAAARASMARAETLRATSGDLLQTGAVLAANGEAMARAAEEAKLAFERGSARISDASAALAGSSAILAESAQGAAPALSSGKGSGNFIWSSNGARLEINYTGEIEFADDDADVTRLSPGGSMRIKDGGWFGSHTVEFKADASGNITRRYWSGMSEKPFEPEGRQWLAAALPKFIRQTGIGARGRVARILKARGTAGVLAEIALIDGSYAKRIYFTELLRTPIDATAAGQVLAQAGREIDSDYELATLLIDAAGKLLVTDAAQQAYFAAAKGISSDYEMRRVYSAALKQGPLPPALVGAILDSSAAIESDYEHASLLIQVAGLQPFDARTSEPFFRALGSVSSDYERGRVLKEVLRRQDLSDDTVLRVVRATGTMGSDYEIAQVLLAVSGSRALSGAARDAYIDAASRLGDHEQGRVLAALVKSERR